MKRFARRSTKKVLGRIGRVAEEIAQHAGQMALLSGRTVLVTLRGSVSLRSVLDQFWAMGVQSLPLVLVTAVISGVVTTQQGGYQLTSTIPLYVLGSVVASSVVLELGPVMTSFVLIGRVGARITAELGTMQVSEQIDALHSLGRDPVAVLAAPRIIAGTITTPLLVSIANVVGIFSGMIAAELSLGLGYESFLYGARMYWHSWALLDALNKGVGVHHPPHLGPHGLPHPRGGRGRGAGDDLRRRVHDHLAPRPRRHVPVAVPELIRP
jgi:phospholipid/cholesterol/gamma-HCH transport system permease protein